MSKALDEILGACEYWERREADGEYLARLACDHCGVPWADLMAKAPTWGRGKGRRRGGGNAVKTRRVVKCRDLAVQLLRGKEPPNALYSFPEIAHILGLKTHATALYSFRRSKNVPLTVEELGKRDRVRALSRPWCVNKGAGILSPGSQIGTTADGLPVYKDIEQPGKMRVEQVEPAEQVFTHRVLSPMVILDPPEPIRDRERRSG